MQRHSGTGRPVLGPRRLLLLLLHFEASKMKMEFLNLDANQVYCYTNSFKLAGFS